MGTTGGNPQQADLQEKRKSGNWGVPCDRKKAHSITGMLTAIYLLYLTDKIGW